jgi:hypothetical protein
MRPRPTSRPAATTSEPEDGAAGYLADRTDSHVGFLACIGAPTPDSGDGSAEPPGRRTSATSTPPTVTYLRPGKRGELVVWARVSKSGQSLTMCEAEVEQDGGVLVHASATFTLGGS